MSGPDIPNFGALLAPYIGQVPTQAVPRFLALLERGAAERYRQWASQLPEHEDVLWHCARSEDEIADRVEAAIALDPSMHEALNRPLPEAKATYLAALGRFELWDQLRVQANAERQGAKAWRNIAAGTSDANVIAELALCSALEEASADRLDGLIAAHAPSESETKGETGHLR